ncbi:MAG: AraC family transcriptional regulator [Verrucomicrobiales bacterium]|nr:AraC family transcriptional regulator [Verrucomicrobiales bacterium]
MHPGFTVTRVAFELGFSSSQHFATVFSRFAGQSPRAFIRAHREPDH